MKKIESFTPTNNLNSSFKVTDEISKFIFETKINDIPMDAITASKKSILDGIGLAISGLHSEAGSIAFKYLNNLGLPSGPASAIGANKKWPMRFAAFLNGLTMHADDFDDTQLAVAKNRVYGLLTHPTAPCLPAVIAACETKRATGNDLLLAYNLGIEVETKISEAISPRHYQHGFHSTGTCGGFASATAMSKLFDFNKEQINNCLSITASQSSGLRENFGTMTKPFHAGKAAESGIIAYELTQLGFSASNNILEAPRGFFQAHGGAFDELAIIGKLGAPWTFNSPGISIKPHPSGSLTHPAMTAMLELIEEYKFSSDDIKKISVGTNHNMPNALIHHRPLNEYQAKFSMEYSMAILVIEGKAGLEQYQNKFVQRKDIQNMIAKVDFYIDPVAEDCGYDKMTSIVSIDLVNGKKITKTLDFGKGSPENPMTYDEVSEKFMECVNFVNWPIKKAREIISIISSIEECNSLDRLFSNFRAN